VKKNKGLCEGFIFYLNIEVNLLRHVEFIYTYNAKERKKYTSAEVISQGFRSLKRNKKKLNVIFVYNTQHTGAQQHNTPSKTLKTREREYKRTLMLYLNENDFAFPDFSFKN